MARRKFDKQTIEQWKAELREELKRDDIIYGIIRKVSASGMTRHLDFYRFAIDGEEVRKHWLSPRIAAITGMPFEDTTECVVAKGCGMNMVRHTVYTLGRALWPDGLGGLRDGGYVLHSETL